MSASAWPLVSVAEKRQPVFPVHATTQPVIADAEVAEDFVVVLAEQRCGRSHPGPDARHGEG